jgi:hypothetical protein
MIELRLVKVAALLAVTGVMGAKSVSGTTRARPVRPALVGPHVHRSDLDTNLTETFRFYNFGVRKHDGSCAFRFVAHLKAGEQRGYQVVEEDLTNCSRVLVRGNWKHAPARPDWVRPSSHLLSPVGPESNDDPYVENLEPSGKMFSSVDAGSLIWWRDPPHLHLAELWNDVHGTVLGGCITSGEGRAKANAKRILADKWTVTSPASIQVTGITCGPTKRTDTYVQSHSGAAFQNTWFAAHVPHWRTFCNSNATTNVTLTSTVSVNSQGDPSYAMSNTKGGGCSNLLTEELAVGVTSPPFLPSAQTSSAAFLSLAKHPGHYFQGRGVQFALRSDDGIEEQ